MACLTRPPPAKPSACVLGIDPGLQRTGYAVLAPAPPPCEARIVEAGVVALSRAAPLAARLVELADGLTEIITRHRPAVLACEELYAHYRHPRTAILMGHARGVVLATAARAGLSIVPVPPTQAKKLLTGSGRATKPQMQRAVAAAVRLPGLPEPHDVADAIAIALCGLRLRAAAETVAAATARSVAGRGGRPRAGGVAR